MLVQDRGESPGQPQRGLAHQEAEMIELDERFATLIELLQSNGASADLMGPVPEDEIATAEHDLGVVFPSTYRRFLRHFGAGNVLAFEIYGLPRDRLWGDVVMMNHLAARSVPVPGHYVKFTEDDSRGFYFDTSLRNEAGECPVVAISKYRTENQQEERVASSFLDFLRKASEAAI